MKTMNKQEADYASVKKFLEDNKGASVKEAVAHTAKEHNKNAGTVQASYYRMQKKNDPTPTSTTAPAKKKTAARKVAKPSSALDLNVLRTTLTDALRTIDELEIQKIKNDKIVSDLRTALNV